jgi:hypothetical protein
MTSIHSELERDPAQLSDAELAAYIEHCGGQMLAANMLFEGTGDAAMREVRQQWLSRQEAALLERQRRPEVVAAMEKDRGLS